MGTEKLAGSHSYIWMREASRGRWHLDLRERNEERHSEVKAPGPPAGILAGLLAVLLGKAGEGLQESGLDL